MLPTISNHCRRWIFLRSCPTMFSKGTWKTPLQKANQPSPLCFLQREQLAAVTAIANHHRLLSPLAPTIDDPDVNVVDIDDGIEKSTSGTTSLSCQESFNSDQRYSPSTHTDISYTKSPNAPELDPSKCVVCMVGTRQSFLPSVWSFVSSI